AAPARDVRSAGTASPVPKYIFRRLSAKRRMEKHAIVFVDIERYESADGRDAVQRVKEEPLMLREPDSGIDRRGAFLLGSRVRAARDLHLPQRHLFNMR